MTLNEANLEKRFQAVSTSQGSIQSLSFFCLHYKNDHKKIARIWLRCLQKARVPHRLTLIYLANDIVQNAKRKNILSFIEDFKQVLKDTVPYLRDEKIKKSVERVFSIWQDRNIFDSSFTNVLKNALNSDSARLNSSTAISHTNDKNTSKSHPNANSETHNTIETKNQRTNDILDSLERLNSIEMNIDKLRPTGETTLDYVNELKKEIDERERLWTLLEVVLDDQKKLLKESEDQLVAYKALHAQTYS